jgi:hypothetical protein
MTDIGDWARERAYETASRFGTASDPERAFYVAGFVQGASDLANLLVSDGAVDAATDQMWRNGRVVNNSELRLALQAALNAISNPETPDSETGSTD